MTEKTKAKLREGLIEIIRNVRMPCKEAHSAMGLRLSLASMLGVWATKVGPEAAWPFSAMMIYLEECTDEEILSLGKEAEDGQPDTGTHSHQSREAGGSRLKEWADS